MIISFDRHCELSEAIQLLRRRANSLIGGLVTIVIKRKILLLKIAPMLMGWIATPPMAARDDGGNKSLN